MNLRAGMFTSRVQRRAWAAGLTGLAGMLAVVVTGGAAASTGPAVTVTVTPGQSLATVSRTAIGINGSTYDGSLLDQAVPGLLRNAGIGLVRIPGGTQSDEYDWKTNTDPIHNNTEAVNFGQFMSMIQKAGAQTM